MSDRADTTPGQRASEPDESLFGGRYLLGDLLGVGGTASVFTAQDTGVPGEGSAVSGRQVALKILHPHLSTDAASRDAFLTEARAAQVLHHPNIAAVHDSGVEETAGVALAWIALDLVDGGSVGERVDASGPLPPAEAAAVLDGVLAALAVAHEVRLVHRDVSPANVLLHGVGPDEALRAEHVRLVDFGLADAAGRTAVGRGVLRADGDTLHAGPGADGSAVTVVLGVAPGRTVTVGPAASAGKGTGTARTRVAGGGDTRTVVGNPQFMSPEQALGRPVRLAGDLYQAGALLYYLLTGSPPYPRDTDAQVLEAHVSAPPPVPSALAPGARAFDRVVTRAMNKTPVRRFRDAAEMRAALTAAAGILAQPGEPGQAPDGGSSSADQVMDQPPATWQPPSTRRAGDLGYLAPAEPDPVSVPAARSSAAGAAVVVITLVVAGLAVWSAVTAPGLPEYGSSPSPRAASESPSPSATPSRAASSSPAPSVSREPSPTATPRTTAAPSPSTPATPAPSATTGPTAAPPPTRVPVPVLVGTLAEAQAALGEAGLVLGEVRRTEAPDPQDAVLDQRPAGGRAVSPGTAVDVTVASGRNVVPMVAGMTLGAAVAELETAGFEAVPEDANAPPTLPASGTAPPAGTVLRLGVSVTVLGGEPEPMPSGT